MAKRHIVSNILLGVAFGAAVTLGGCDNNKNKSGEGGAAPKLNIQLDATHSATIGPSLPGNIPDYAKVYPGANVMGVVTMTAMPNAPWTATIQYTAAAKPEVVLAFYKQNAAGSVLFHGLIIAKKPGLAYNLLMLEVMNISTCQP